MTDDQKSILMEIALSDGLYDSEYDGRTYTHCFYCNGGDESHEDDCTIMRARKALGSIWEDYVEEQECIAEENRKANAERERKYLQTERDRQYKREKVECDSCGSMVARMGLKDHKASMRCAKKTGEKKTGFKCIENTDSYDGKRCQHCNKPMPDAHPNKKFCSNSGRGNCKDRHHNSVNISRRPRHQFVDYDDHADLVECEVGWDAHKDMF